MASFDPAFAFLMANEGSKLLNDPQTGEYSRFGVTLSTASLYKLCAPNDKAFIDNLTEDAAKDFYLGEFWQRMKLSNVHSQDVANKLLDMSVNIGPGMAVHIAQTVCNTLGKAVAVDGCMGWITLTALNYLDPHHLLLELRAESLEFYRALVKQNPEKFEKYWDTWKDRAEK